MPELKSSLFEAENESSAINMQGNSLQPAISVFTGSTNLPVIDNLQEATAALTSCNQKYKALLQNHAEGIAQLGQEFQDFDSKLSEKMGIK